MVKAPKEGEIFETLLEHKNIKVEKITSSDKIPDKVYEQKQDEWVQQRHKVLETKAGTIWLAVHIF